MTSVVKWDDGDAVAVAQALADGLRRRPRDGHAVPPVHRAGGVEHERHVQGGVVAHVGRLQGDAGDVPVAVERMPHQVAGDGEAAVVRGPCIAEVEGVDPLLRAHGVGLDGVAVADPGKGEEVGRAVRVEAEGRDGVGGRVHEGDAAVVLEGGARGLLGWRGLRLGPLGGRAADVGHLRRRRIVRFLLRFFLVIAFVGHVVVGHHLVVVAVVRRRFLRRRAVIHRLGRC